MAFAEEYPLGHLNERSQEVIFSRKTQNSAKVVKYDFSKKHLTTASIHSDNSVWRQLVFFIRDNRISHIWSRKRHISQQDRSNNAFHCEQFKELLTILSSFSS